MTKPTKKTTAAKAKSTSANEGPDHPAKKHKPTTEKEEDEEEEEEEEEEGEDDEKEEEEDYDDEEEEEETDIIEWDAVEEKVVAMEQDFKTWKKCGGAYDQDHHLKICENAIEKYLSCHFYSGNEDAEIWEERLEKVTEEYATLRKEKPSGSKK